MLSPPQIQDHKTLENMTMIPFCHIITSFIIYNGDTKPNQIITMTTFTRMHFHSNAPSILNNESQEQQIQILVNVDELETHLP